MNSSNLRVRYDSVNVGTPFNKAGKNVIGRNKCIVTIYFSLPLLLLIFPQHYQFPINSLPIAVLSSVVLPFLGRHSFNLVLFAIWCYFVSLRYT